MAAVLDTGVDDMVRISDAAAAVRGWVRFSVEHVLQANEGADLDLLVGAGGAATSRHSH